MNGGVLTEPDEPEDAITEDVPDEGDVDEPDGWEPPDLDDDEDYEPEEQPLPDDDEGA